MPTSEPTKLFSLDQFNPLIGKKPTDTMHRVSCVLQYLKSLEHDKEFHFAADDNWCYGRDLIYTVLIDALRKGQD